MTIAYIGWDNQRHLVTDETFDKIRRLCLITPEEARTAYHVKTTSKWKRFSGLPDSDVTEEKEFVQY